MRELSDFETKMYSTSLLDSMSLIESPVLLSERNWSNLQEVLVQSAEVIVDVVIELLEELGVRLLALLGVLHDKVRNFQKIKEEGNWDAQRTSCPTGG